MVKKVERNEHEWDQVLGEHLHEYLNYRANVNLMEKVNNENVRSRLVDFR